MTEQTLAHHEAAHAVVSLLVGWPLQRVSIVPNQVPDSLGHSLPAVRIDDRESSDWLLVTLAGPAAERELTGRPAVGDSADLEVARALLAVTLNVPGDAPLVAQRLKEWGFVANLRVREHWLWIQRTARQLRRRRTLTGADVAALYRPEE